jgi:hypothetical protein
MEAAVLGYYAMEQSTLQEERDVSRMGDGYVEANGLQRHTTEPVRFLTAEMSAREMAVVASYTQHG